MTNKLTEAEREIVHRPRCSEDENGNGCDCGARQVVARIKADAVAEVAARVEALHAGTHQCVAGDWYTDNPEYRGTIATRGLCPTRAALAGTSSQDGYDHSLDEQYQQMLNKAREVGCDIPPYDDYRDQAEAIGDSTGFGDPNWRAE